MLFDLLILVYFILMILAVVQCIRVIKKIQELQKSLVAVNTRILRLENSLSEHSTSLQNK